MIKLEFGKSISDFEKEIKKLAMQELNSRVAQIELVYCPIHGKFAEVKTKHFMNEESTHFEYSFCCENLKKDIEITLKILQTP